VALGHSSGGASLGIAAGRMPGLFRRIVMVDPIVFPRRAQSAEPPTAAAAGMADRTSRRRAARPSAQEMFDSLKDRGAFATWRPEALWDYVNHGAAHAEDGTVTLKCPPALEAQMYRHAGNLDLFEEFARTSVPVLLIRGGQSDRFPRANAERAAATIPHGRLVELPDLTHFASMEDPEAVASLAVPFLQGKP
jgi:pimeloyl-ACP methyl ester carboxylesterase